MDSLATQIGKEWDDHVYEEIIKELISEANATIIPAYTPRGETGKLEERTYIYLTKESDSDKAVIRLVSEPFYATITNQKGTSAGWYRKLEAAIASHFGAG